MCSLRCIYPRKKRCRGVRIDLVLSFSSTKEPVSWIQAEKEISTRHFASLICFCVRD
ncbi:hypothetical protein KP509_10G081200 [Ceratopteris richardii]|uniref:Uncharacterized protein n=1 Tax=Ceratopteris richardii TaxID=49495 RepID=A0A8T2TXI1_CERRI|nr:hypothetical protein KP509_10G081200 [Ceratopteris richardii]